MHVLVLNQFGIYMVYYDVSRLTEEILHVDTVYVCMVTYGYCVALMVLFCENDDILSISTWQMVFTAKQNFSFALIRLQ